MLHALAFNIHGWKGMDRRFDVERLARIIAGAATDAAALDVVALNEVYHPFVQPDAAQPLLARLAARLGMNFVFAPTLPPGPFDDPQTAFGNAILSPHPILAFAGHRLTTPAGHPARVLLEARLLLPDRRSLTVYATHLDHQSEAVRMGQVQALLLWAGRDRGRSHLLLGDLNSLAPADYVGQEEAVAHLQADAIAAHLVRDGMQVLPRLLKAGYHDCFARAGQGTGLTYGTAQEKIRIDYCLAAGPLADQVTACRRLDDDDVRLASDHFPLLTEFAW
ncbi:MAG: endonuclease/exonuclease/phosphatase family protein [Anaerolineae bacterium]